MTAGGPGASKVCLVCGRTMTWRKRWARTWDDVKTCSEACRRAGIDDTDRALEAAILALLDERARDATICPSEAARRVSPGAWETLLERARRAARRLVAQGAVEITQKGRVVDPSGARGPIRVRRAGRG